MAARALGLGATAVTDHNTLAGIARAHPVRTKKGFSAYTGFPREIAQTHSIEYRLLCIQVAV